MSYLSEWFNRFLIPIDDPSSRLFHLNLFIAIVFIVLWMGLKSNKKSLFQQFKKLIFRKKYWWNRSTKIDYQIYFLNSLFKIFLFIPFLDMSYKFSKWTANGLLSFHQYESVSLSATTTAIFVFSVFAFVFDDFLRFFHHLLMHKIPFLWKIHQTHHSARILTPMTLYRAHPLESAMSTVRNSMSTGVPIGFFIFLFDSQFSIFTILGINLFGFLFNLLGSNLRHSHIDINFGFLEPVFISPKQHQIHHSIDPKHYDKNFGVSLSLWDRILGTLVFSKAVTTPLKFGLKNRRQTLKQTLGFQ